MCIRDRPEGGEGLEGLMYACRDKLSGILNGLDYTEYDPQKDVYLTNHYNEVNYKEGKALNKTRLQKNVSLPVDGDVFLIGMVSVSYTHLVAAALDAMHLHEVVGCIAGDDTIMCAVRSVQETNPSRNTLVYFSDRSSLASISATYFCLPPLTATFVSFNSRISLELSLIHI